MDDRKKRKREKLNRLGEEWYRMPEQGNEDARLALREKIFVLAYELFPRESDAMGRFFQKDWHKFDPDKGDLYGFMSFRLKKRKIDIDEQDYDGYYANKEDEDAGEEPHNGKNEGKEEKKKVKKRYASLYAPIGEDSSTLGDTVAGGANADGSVMIDALALEMMTLILGLKDRLKGQANNSTRINYFRLFFTDGAVNAIQSDISTAAFARRERDLFRVIKETFLNFFMSSPCTSVEDILLTGLKPYGRMVEGQPMEPPKRPLPNDVYITYLRQAEHYTATAQALSQQRTAYKTFMKDQLQC